MNRRKLNQGFTLVELMIVVAITGVLAVLAVVGVRKYLANAKTAEAKNSLGSISKGAVAAFESERRKDSAVLTPGAADTLGLRLVCGDASAKVPANVANIKGTKYQSKKDDWQNQTDVSNNAGFPCLRFEISDPQYYQYYYNGSGATDGTFTAYAYGDLNGDDTLSTFSMTGKVNEGRLLVAPTVSEISPEE